MLYREQLIYSLDSALHIVDHIDDFVSLKKQSENEKICRQCGAENDYMY